MSFHASNTFFSVQVCKNLWKRKICARNSFRNSYRFYKRNTSGSIFLEKDSWKTFSIVSLAKKRPMKVLKNGPIMSNQIPRQPIKNLNPKSRHNYSSSRFSMPQNSTEDLRVRRFCSTLFHSSKFSSVTD